MAGLSSAFIRFNKGLLKMPVPWQLWLMLAAAVFSISPAEAQKTDLAKLRTVAWKGPEGTLPDIRLYRSS